MPEIKVNNLTVKYYNKKKKEEVTALENLNVDFESGKFNVILGYSGCGKTTLLKSIIGTIDYEGEITYDGIPAEGLSIQDRNLSFVSQNFVLFPHMTIFDNIAFPLKTVNAKKEEIVSRVYEIAEMLEIKQCLSRKPKHLSIGQQQRVAIAKALVKRPNLILFDEPLSNLDPILRMEARYVLKKVIRNFDITVVYVTHDLREAMALADKIFIINDKKIELEGTPSEIYEADNEFVKILRQEIENSNVV